MVRRAAATSETLLPWGPILVGVGAVVGLLVTAVALPLGLPGEPTSGDRPPPAAAPPVFPSEPPGPPVEPDGQDSRAQDPAELDRGSGESRGGGRADRGGADEPGGATTPPPEPEAGGAGDPGAGAATQKDLVAGYRVVEAFDDEFIAEVKVSNRTTEPQAWTVRLRYPDTVGKLQVAWVESAPQAEIKLANGTFVFSGAEPVAGRDSVALRVRFERRGNDISPALCTVNGAGCAVS